MQALWSMATLLAIVDPGFADTLDLKREALGTQATTCGISWFQERRFFEPLAAEPRAAQLNALAFARGKPVEFLRENKSTRSYWDIDVGTEMPIVSRSCAFPSGRSFGVGYWIAVDFHMLESLDDPSAPILNTDYRFAFANLKAQYGLDAFTRLALRVQLGHESTHLGDEYSLAARRLFNDFRRINVSYEWIDIAASLDQQDGYVSWRLGVVTTLPFNDSYYTADTLEAPGPPITPSSNWWEPYAGFQKRFQPRLFGATREIYVSTDARWKTIYDYDRLASSGPEDRQLSVNMLIGATANERPASPGLGRVSPYLRLYYGVNPHGQFRNQRSFRLIGFGVRMHR